MSLHQNGPSPTQPRRRSVLATGAWAAPAIVVGAASPALAASDTTDPPAVTGFGSITRTSCAATATAPGAVAVTFDTRPAYSTSSQPTAGYWITNLSTSVSVTSATQTIYVDSRFTNVNWSYASTSTNQRQWSLPKLDTSAPVLSGLVAYTTTYQPTIATPWTRVNGTQLPYAIATAGQYFNLTATTPANTCSGLFTFRNYRTVVLSDGTVLTNLKAPATA